MNIGFVTGGNNMNQIKDVQPIRTRQQIEDMKWALRRHCSERLHIIPYWY